MVERLRAEKVPVSTKVEQGRYHQDQDARPSQSEPPHRALEKGQVSAEDVPEAAHDYRPADAAQDVVDKKSPVRHLADAGEKRREHP